VALPHWGGGRVIVITRNQFLFTSAPCIDHANNTIIVANRDQLYRHTYIMNKEAVIPIHHHRHHRRHHHHNRHNPHHL